MTTQPFPRLSLALLLAAASAASAAPTQPVAPVTKNPLPPPVVAPVQPAVTPRYDSLVKRDAAGKIIRVSGILDALALLRNPQVDDAGRAAMAPTIADWTAEVNQVAIDNLDFVEQMEAGLLDSYDVNDVSKTRLVQQMNVQLSAAGPLSARLSQKNLFSGQGAGVNMQISNEYIQAVFNELNTAPAPGGAGQPYANAAAVNRFFTSLSSRDACEQHRRMMVDSAALVDQIMPDLTAPARVKAAPKLAAVKAAQDDAAKLVAVRDLLRELPFADRRAFLTKAVALGAAADPFHPAPEYPGVAAKPAEPAPKPGSN